MKASLCAVFVALSVFSKVQAGRRSFPLKDSEVAALTEQYDLKLSKWGHFLYNETFRSTTTINLTSGPAPLGASYIMLLNGVCHGWIVFAESDRVFTWISGKAMIDLAKPDGEIISVCLGDSLVYPTCVYTLVIPAGWKTDFRPFGHLLFTGVAIGGSAANNVPVTFDDMREQYSAYRALIDKVEAECS